MKRIIIALLVLLAGCSPHVPQSEGNALAPLWKYEGMADVLGSAVRGSGKHILCASVSGTELVGLNGADGVPIWHLEIDTKPGPDANFAPIVAGGKVFSFAGDSLFAHDLASGYELWRFQTELTGLGPPSFYQPDAYGRQVFAGTASGYLYCIDAGSGFGNWREKSRYEGFGQVTCWRDKVIVRTLSGKVEARNRITGKLIWKNELWMLPDDKLTVDSDMLLIAEYGPTVAALDPGRGAYVWQKRLSVSTKTRPLKSSPVISGNLLAVVQDNDIFFFDKMTGADLSKLHLDFAPVSVAITDKNIFAVKGSKLVAFAMDKQKVGEFVEPNGDELLGVTVCDGAVVTWSPRAIYGLSK